jgi:O-antigen ligase
MTTNVRSDYPALFWTLVGLVVLAPLPLGSVFAWSWALIALVVGGLLLVWGILVVIGAQHATLGLQSTWFLVLPFAVAVVWILAQALPITPESWHHPLWATAAEALETDIAGSVSLNPYQTMAHLVRLLTYAGIFWLALQYSRKTIRARQILMALGYAGFAYAAYGLIVYAFDLKTVFFDNPAYEGSLTSTFVNRNSYATYVGLGLVCVTALILVTIAMRANTVLAEMTRDLFTNVDKAHATHMAEPTLYNGAVLTRVVAGLTRADWFLAVMWICMVLALLFTHSRGGFLSVVVALVALVVVIAMTRTPHRGYAATAAIGAVVVVGVLFALAGSGLESRLASLTAASEERPRVYELTLSAINDAPVLGTGYGTFEEVFRFYRTSDIHGYYTMAHSSYLENVLELGLPAAIALFMVFGGFLYITFRGIRVRRRDSVFACVGFAATVLVALHSAVDFSLQIPAVAATYALLMGAACGQSWSTQRPKDTW